MTTKRVPLITRAKNSGGVIWSGTIKVIARRGTKELWAYPGHVSLVEDAENHWRDCRSKTVVDIRETCFVSRALFARQAIAINEFFGCEVAGRLDPYGTTLVIEES